MLGAIGYVGFTQIRARNAGLPPPSFKSYVPFLHADRSASATNYPSPRSSGPVDWIKDQINKLSNRRTAGGAYEETGAGLETGTAYAGGSGRRGRGLDDDAWDTRVGNEDGYGTGIGGYYEEQELGLAPTPGLHSEPYGGGSSYMGSGAGRDDGRGRSKSREPADTLKPHDRSVHVGENPFADDHEEASLRDVSPRPEIDTRGATPATAQGHTDGYSSLESPTDSRRSAFHEEM